MFIGSHLPRKREGGGGVRSSPVLARFVPPNGSGKASLACNMKVPLEKEHAKRLSWEWRAAGRCFNTMVIVGRELSLKDGQPDHTLQQPELPGEPILGSHVRKTVLLKIQNIRVFT